MKNIDKDIEILKGIKRCSLTGGFDKQTERLNAISRIIAIVKNNRMAFEKQTENLREVEAERDNFKSELETYKKIAEKLAEELKRRAIFYNADDTFDFCDLPIEDYEECPRYNNGANCKQCIIDWARNEVEK